MCRLDNDEDAHALHGRITHYFEDHPRLTALRQQLNLLPPLLDEIQRSANRTLQTPKSKGRRREKVAAYGDAVATAKQFVKELHFETDFLPARTGLAAYELAEIDAIMQLPAPARAEQRDGIGELVEEGRRVVEESRATRAPNVLSAAVSSMRSAF